jgi:diaminopimelate decarboxylase
LQQAVAAGVLVNVEGRRDLSPLAAAQAQLARPARVALRVNPDFELKGSGMRMGGGFGVPYFPGEQSLHFAPIGQNLNALLERAAQEMPQAQLVLELGRYLVAEAGVYVARVLDRKLSRGQVFLVTDGGLHHHLAASGNFGQVVRRNYPVRIGTRMQATADEHELASVVEPLCTPLNLLADRLQLARAKEGDLVVVFQAGA